MNLKIARYEIYEEYNGLFDSNKVLCFTDNLFDAVHLVELLKKTEEENPCYSYDFKKITSVIEPDKDFYPSEKCGKSHVYRATNYADFLEEYKKHNKKEK